MLYTFHLRTVTEVFAGGADLQTAELRPSAFRGPLRFWFRAMMGKIVGNDFGALKRLEALAFGATDAGSPFILRLTDLPHSVPPGTLVTPPIGKAYLAFSMYTRANRQVYLSRGCIPADQTFTLSLRFKMPSQGLQNVVLGSLWLLLNFGGVGGRSRRGFGALKAESVLENQQPLPFNYFSTGPDVEQHYRKGLSLVEGWFRSFADTAGVIAKAGEDDASDNAEFATFSNWMARLIARARTGAPAQAEDADHWLNQWGILLRSFRNGTRVSLAQPDLVQRLRDTTCDYRKVIAYAMDGYEPKRSYLENDVFGLPVVFQSSTRGGRQMTLSWHGPDQKKGGRRGSPLLLHPILLPDGRYAALATFFISRFLPDGAHIPIACPSGNALEAASDTVITDTAADFFEYLEKELKPRVGQAGDVFAALP